MTPRSYLFVPGNRCDLIGKAIRSGTEAITFDLEDAIPADEKNAARREVAETLFALRREGLPQLWLRINAAGTPAAEADLDELGDLVDGIRVPKVQSMQDLDWVTARCPDSQLIAAIETARGLLNAAAIAVHQQVTRLAMGGVDLVHDLDCRDDPTALLHARSLLVVASRAAALPGPINSVYPALDDQPGLRAHTAAACRLGFTAQSLLSPRQVATVHEVLSPDFDQLAWAERVLTTFRRSSGNPARTDAGEFVDIAVARKAATLIRASERSTNPHLTELVAYLPPQGSLVSRDKSNSTE